MMEKARITGSLKSYRVNPDGTTTRLNSMRSSVEFITNEPEVKAPIASDEIIKLSVDGLYQNTTTAFPGGNEAAETYSLKNFKLGGKLRKNALISGKEHWFVNEALGANSFVYVDANGDCWLTTFTNKAADLSTFTLEFRALPSTSATPPVRSVIQTVTASGASPLDATDEYFHTTATTVIEDIATNGRRLIMARAIPPFGFYSSNPSNIGPFNYTHAGSIMVSGRYLYGAVELVITGKPPEAIVSIVPLYTSVQARGTFHPFTGNSAYSIKWWENMLVGMRYTPGDVAEPVLQTVKSESWVVRTQSENFDYVAAGPYGPIVFPARKEWWSYRHLKSVTQEGVKVEMESLANSLTHKTVLTGDGLGPDVNGQPTYYSTTGYTPDTETFETVGKLGYATYVSNDAEPQPLSHPGFSITHTGTPLLFYDDNQFYYTKPTYRPVWNGDLRMDLPGFSSAKIDETSVGSSRANYGVLGVKYSNRVFGLQTVVMGQPVPGASINKTGPGLAYPACSGANVVAGNLKYAVNIDTAEVKTVEVTTPFTRGVSVSSQYPTKSNPYMLRVTATMRHISPKAVMGQENLVYVHYF